MIIEIRNAGFLNKGAELMLHAVVQKIRARYPTATLVMAPTHLGGSRPFHKFTELGIYPKLSLWKYGVQWGDFAKLLPSKLREMYGVILDQEIDVVLDVAGFAYSDQWGAHTSKDLARSSKRWKKNGTKVILLPQAFGPYKQPLTQRWVKRWINNVDLIFARESDSYEHLTGVVGEQGKISIFPDFTNLVNGSLPINYDASYKRIALIPNYRMLDKTSNDDSKAYVPFMIRCAQYLVKQDAKPFLLIHEGENDRVLAEEISSAVGGIPVVQETNPIHIKGIIGSCDATIGSRFHGLVSALSQGVPSLATSWSHKYLKLFEEYGVRDWIVSVNEKDGDLFNKLAFFLEPETSRVLAQTLTEKSDQMKQMSEVMWEHVFSEIDSLVK